MDETKYTQAISPRSYITLHIKMGNNSPLVLPFLSAVEEEDEGKKLDWATDMENHFWCTTDTNHWMSLFSSLENIKTHKCTHTDCKWKWEREWVAEK